jgi:hypothetical protein
MVLFLLPACAWQNPDNRILWDAFETHWVPENEPASSLALPLTVPAGIVAILIDVTVVHPALVIDDAFEDAMRVWEEIDWQGEYWFESGMVPFRCAGTGVVFVFSLVGRVLFDIPAFEDKGPPPDPEQGAAEWHASHRDWLEALLACELRPAPDIRRGSAAKLDWEGELSVLAERVRRDACHRARIAYYKWALRARPEGEEDLWLGLTDTEARVRASMLVLLSARPGMPVELVEALRADPDPVVAELAWQLLQAPH